MTADLAAIVHGSPKQIAYAESIRAKTAHPSMGGHRYTEQQMETNVSAAIATIERAEMPAAQKAAAMEIVHAIPSLAVAWIDFANADTILQVVEAILGGTQGYGAARGLAAEFRKHIH